MKGLHTSDGHLGQHFYSRSRAQEHKAFLQWLNWRVTEQQVDAMMVACLNTHMIASASVNSGVLSHASDNMIGVISHVEAIKERIPVQIKVRKKMALAFRCWHCLSPDVKEKPKQRLKAAADFSMMRAACR